MRIDDLVNNDFDVFVHYLFLTLRLFEHREKWLRYAVVEKEKA